MSNKAAIQNIRQCCAEALTSLGFKRRELGILTFKLNGQFQGWLGLNSATKSSPDSMAVNPMVGVRADDVHSIISRVIQERPHRYIPPTIGRNIGYFMPGQKFGSYEFPFNEAPFEQAANMARDVQQYGLPFIMENASLPNIITLLPSHAIWEDAGERLLAAYYLTGKDRESLIKFIEDRIESGKLEKRYWQRFEQFAAAFKSQLLGAN